MDGEPTRVLTDLAMVAALVLLVGVPSLFTRDLWAPDEPRYLEVAREMVVLGDYLVPHLNGEVYSEKPPMFFWVSGFLWRAGVGYNAGRVVTILSVLGTLSLVFLAVRRLVGRREALLAAASSLSTLLLFSFVRIGNLDALLMFFVTSSVLAGFWALRQGQHGFRDAWWMVSYGCMGLGTLTKGPVGILVPALVLLAYAIVNRRCIRPGGWAHLAGVVLLGAIVAAWLVPAIVVGGGEYAHGILLKQNVGRAVAAFTHREPPYWYVLWAPVCFFPWTFVLPVCVAAAIQWWRRTQEDLPLLAVAWLLVPLVFFSLVSGKRVNYIVPVVPAVGILSGWYLASAPRARGTLAKVDRRLLGAAFVLLILFIVGLITALVAVTVSPWLLHFVSDRQKEFLQSLTESLAGGRLVVAVLMLAVPLMVSVVGLALSSRKSLAAAGGALAVTVLLMSLAQDLVFTPAVNRLKSGREFAAAVQQYAAGSRRVYVLGNDYAGVYNLYMGMARIPVIRSRARLRALMKMPDVLVIADERDLGYALTPEEIGRHVLHRQKAGSRCMVVLASRAGTSGSPGYPPMRTRSRG